MRKPLPRKQRLANVMLPYCLKREPGSPGYVLLNRDYKPIGFNTSEWIQYEEYPIIHRMRITPQIAAKLSWNNEGGTESIKLYSRLTSKKDIAEYLERLQYLSGLLAKTDVVAQNIKHI